MFRDATRIRQRKVLCPDHFSANSLGCCLELGTVAAATLAAAGGAQATKLVELPSGETVQVCFQAVPLCCASVQPRTRAGLTSDTLPA